MPALGLGRNLHGGLLFRPQRLLGEAVAGAELCGRVIAHLRLCCI